MKYLVMECHPGYAVVLDAQGRFLQVANENFQVGQKVDSVIALEAPKQAHSGRWVRNLAVMAACLCLIVLGAWQMLMPYGTVRMTINPDVQFSVNRLDYVLEITPLNEDAEVLLRGYDANRKKIDAVLDELADRAAQMGYLKDGRDIHVTVESSHKQWQVATQDRLIAELEVHTGGTVIITPEPAPQPQDTTPVDTTPTDTTPVETAPVDTVPPVTEPDDDDEYDIDYDDEDEDVDDDPDDDWDDDEDDDEDDEDDDDEDEDDDEDDEDTDDDEDDED